MADTLGVPYDWVNMDVSNTDSSPLCTGTFASRGTFIGGLRRAQGARRRPRRSCSRSPARRWRSTPADLEVEDGEVFVKGSPDKKMTVGDVSGGRDLGLRRADHRLRRVDEGRTRCPTPTPASASRDAAISYAACVVEVEVDDETGDVTVLSMVQAYDVGHAINPTLVEGQIEGGAMMGLGLGLLEASYPHYPSHRGPRRRVRRVPHARRCRTCRRSRR